MSHFDAASASRVPNRAGPSVLGAGAPGRLATESLASRRFSLLRVSAFDRTFGAAMVVVLLWAGVYWALH